MIEINGDLCYQTLLKNQPKKLAYNPECDFDLWRTQLKDKFYELLGIQNIKNNACPLNTTIEEEVECDGYKRIRFVFESEIGSIVPCYILIPNGEVKKRPLAITLQGHSTGFHNSIGVAKFESDYKNIDRVCCAVQAVKNGFVALAIEQRAMGERHTRIHERDWLRMCAFHAITAFELGRTLLGERMWDVSKAIDAIQIFDKYIDFDKILITGNSGGGTMSFYASIFDDRIKLSVPSCAFCSYKTSIMAMYHCACNFIPGALEWFEMEDLAGLLAPKRVAFVAGEKDVIFPIKGVKDSFETVKAIYKRVGAEDKCRLVTHEFGHYWDPDTIWTTIKEETEKLGW